MSLLQHPVDGKSIFNGNRFGFWGAALALGLLFVLVEFSYTQFSLTKQLLGHNSPEGATAGWWWSLSLLWLIAALRRPATETQRGLGGLGHPGFRLYLVAAFSLLSGMEIVQQGPPAAAGFLVGAGAFAAVFLLVDLGAALARKVRLPARPLAFDTEQLPLPF
jgi:hypothetical protein